MSRFIRIRLLACAGACSIAALGGCTDLAQLEVARGDLASWSENAASDADALRAQIASLQPDDPARAEGEALLAALEARRSAADAGLAQIDALLTEAHEPMHPFTQAAESLGEVLPEPIRTPLLLAGAGAALLFRARTLKRGLESVARGMQIACREDEEFSACFKRHADTFRQTQTSAAQRVVDEVIRDRAMLRLPI